MIPHSHIQTSTDGSEQHLTVTYKPTQRVVNDTSYSQTNANDTSVTYKPTQMAVNDTS